MNENPIPKNLRTDHLFLLIGTNPLPNYVAAKLLLKECGQLYLVHSDATNKAMLRLEALLRQKEGLDKFAKIAVNEADAVDIYQKLYKVASGISTGSVGLNYTGGTKVMAVQAHKAIDDSVNDKAVFSYLDARSYEMKFEPIGTSRPPAQKVLLSVSLDLENLLKLHDVQLKRGKSLERKTHLSESAELLAKIHTDRNLAWAWRNWCNSVLRPNTRDNNDKDWIKKPGLLDDKGIPWPEDEALQPVIQMLCTEIGVETSSTIRLGDVLNHPFEKVYHFCRWLDGIWLEHYVYDQIEAIRQDSQLNDIAMSLDTVDHIPQKPNFEVDVGVMRGYQLFGISCTTSLNKGLMKSKLFEAYLRTSQLGGDEARTALICPFEKPDQLQKEIDESIPDKVRVFGAEDLIDLKDQLAKWFTQADHQR